MSRRAHAAPPTSHGPSPTAQSLVDWRQTEPNSHVLDWRERAHEFGLIPVDEQSPSSHAPIDSLSSNRPTVSWKRKKLKHSRNNISTRRPKKTRLPGKARKKK